MNDVLGALMGKKHCGWCTDLPTTWWERLTEQDLYGESSVHWKRYALRAQLWLGEHVPVWKLGNSWHWRFHVKDDDYRKVKGKWCDQRQIGDAVCDCTGTHQKIVDFLDKDTAILENGYHCSLYHCCSEPDPGPDFGCHSTTMMDEYWDFEKGTD